MAWPRKSDAPEPERYRGRDNPKNKRTPIVDHAIKLVPLEPGDKIYAGKKSRRRKRFKWVRV